MIEQETKPDTIQKYGFSGLWIPSEIWHREDLTLSEKCIWSMIYSFSKTESGCFASNKYFAREVKVSEPTVQKNISNLKKLGLIKQVSFDGRFRVLETTLKIGIDK